MNGVKNAKVSVVEIDSSVNEIKSQKTDNVSNYHSAEFEDNKIRFWNYYSVGKGILVEKKFCENVDSNYNSMPCEHKKRRLDRMRNDNVLYCPISDCVKTFLSEEALKNHMLLNNHSYSLTGLDQVKQIYISHVTNSSELNCSFQDNLSVNTESNNTFIMVWALLKSLFSRFNYHQQKYMYNVFIEGETTGKKAAPEKVALEMKTLELMGKSISLLKNTYMQHK